jgi:hypothetical protein
LRAAQAGRLRVEKPSRLVAAIGHPVEAAPYLQEFGQTGEEKGVLPKEDDRLALLWLWNALVVFVALFFLSRAPFQSALVAVFVWVSCALGYGVRWLLRGGLTLAALALAVFAGWLPPEKWGSSFRDLWALLN